MVERDRLALRRALAGLADGDRACFDEVFARLQPLFVAFARRTLGCEADAEDAAQEALLKVFANAHRYDRERDAVAWVIAFVANECRTTRARRRRRREEAGRIEAPAADTASAEAALIGAQLEAAVLEAVGALRAEDAATLRAAIGLDPRPEVAPATFRKRIERAVDRLRTSWRARHEL